MRQKLPLICVTSASPNADCQIATAALFLFTSMSNGRVSFFTTVSLVSARARFALVQSLVSRQGSLVDATWIFLWRRSSLIPKPGLSRVLGSSGMYLVAEFEEDVREASQSSLRARIRVTLLRMVSMTARSLLKSLLLSVVYPLDYLGQQRLVTLQNSLLPTRPSQSP